MLCIGYVVYISDLISLSTHLFSFENLIFSFEGSLRGSDVANSCDSKDMAFAMKVQRRQQQHEQKRQALMISKRVSVSEGCGCEQELYSASNGYDHSFSHSYTDNISSSPAFSNSVSASSVSWWSDLMARKEEAERKGFSSILGGSSINWWRCTEWLTEWLTDWLMRDGGQSERDEWLEQQGGEVRDYGVELEYFCK